MRTLSMKLKRIISKSRRTRNQEEDNFSSAAEEQTWDQTTSNFSVSFRRSTSGEGVGGRRVVRACDLERVYTYSRCFVVKESGDRIVPPVSGGWKERLFFS